MSTTFNVIVGDTFESIARKKYGSEKEALRIAKANPGVSEPLTAGITLVIPSLPDAPQNIQQQSIADNDDEVAILINGRRFRFWDKVRITRSSDSMATFEFGAPFDHSAPGFRETFKPMAFKPVTITVGGEPLFTGTMVLVTPVIENNKRIIAVSGYSLPGVLNDCTPPASMFADNNGSLQFDDRGLREIAATLAAPFGISVEFQADQGAIFDSVACDPGEKVLSFLIGLAKKRNLIISDTARGKLVFLKSANTGKPVARLQQGSAPVLSVTPIFNPQEYYSHITGIEPFIPNLPGLQFTVKNERLQGVVRPLTFKLSDTKDADLKTAVEAKIGRMFGNTASYSISVATWRDSQGKLWTPKTTLTLLAPDAMIYNEYEFEIRNVGFNREGSVETATLNLVIPGSFSGKIPKVLPWDE